MPFEDLHGNGRPERSVHLGPLRRPDEALDLFVGEACELPGLGSDGDGHHLVIAELAAPPRLKRSSMVSWNSIAFRRRSGSPSVNLVSHFEPMRTCVISSASTKSTARSRMGSPIFLPMYTSWLNTSQASPSRPRLTPATRAAASSAQAQRQRIVVSGNSPM